MHSTWHCIQNCGNVSILKFEKCKWSPKSHSYLFEYRLNYKLTRTKTKSTVLFCFTVVQQRYVLTLMAFLALFNAHAMRTNLSMTITRMVVAVVITNETLEYQSQVCSADTFDDLDIDAKYIIAQNPFNNFTSIETTDHDHFEWSQEMQGIILSSFYWGYVLAHLPGGLLAHKYGGKYILAFGIFFSGVLSLLIPVCVHYGGAHSLIAIRMLMGICQGPIIPACMNLLMSWIPLRERCTMLSLVYSGVSVSLRFWFNSNDVIVAIPQLSFLTDQI